MWQDPLKREFLDHITRALEIRHLSLLGGIVPQRASLAICASIFVLFVGSAQAVLTPEQAKCQKTVAKQGRSFFKKRFNALSGCENAIHDARSPRLPGAGT